MTTFRENIIENIRTTLDAITDIRTVKRVHPSFANLKSYPENQLPFIGIMGKLPSTEFIMTGRREGQIGLCKSMLDVDLLIYDRQSADPDTRISELANLIWVALLADTTRGKHAKMTTIQPEVETGVIPPHIAFFMTISVEYIHDTTTI